MILVKVAAAPTAYLVAMPHTSAGPSSQISLLPKEHGAYIQLSLALASGLVLGHGSNPRSWGQALLTALLFLASEPILILLGQRGSKATPVVKRHAKRLLTVVGALSLLSAAFVWWPATWEAWQSLLIPALLASVLLGLALGKREHSTLGELVAAWALASATYPVAVLGGAGAREAGLLALALAGIQSIGTATVRAFLESLKRQSRPLPRTIPLLLGLAIMGLVLASRLPFSGVIALAMVPNTGVATWMLMAPPSPRRLQRMGWILTLAAVTGIFPVLMALR